MSPKFYLLTICVSLLLFSSCKNAEKLYQKGRYDEAVVLATKKLAKKPNDASLIMVVQNAYGFAVADHESRIRNYSNSNSDLRWEKVLQEYYSLQHLYEAVRKSPSVYTLVNPTDYSSYIATYQEEASNARVERGLDLMELGDKNSFRNAYYEFQKALALKPGDLSIKQKMEEAYAEAVINVVVFPLTRTGLQYASYSYDFNRFNNGMLQYLHNHNNNQFLQFHAENTAASRYVRPDNTVSLRFTDVNIGRYRDERSTREVSKQIVGKEIVIGKDSVVKEYITVKAKITTTTRQLQANGVLQASVRDMNNRWLWGDAYRGDYNWVHIFSTYTGDERALSDEDKKLIKLREEWPPSNDEIIRLIMHEIEQKAQCGISDYFKRYN